MASTGGSEGISLDLKPMLDVFSVLITFLLMTFSSDPVSHDVSPGIELPESKTIVSLDEIPSITVTKGEIKVGDIKVANIIAGDVEEKARTQGAIYPLYEELVKLMKTNVKVMERLGIKDEVKVGTITMEMDESHRFKLMKRIMLSGQQAEFITFKLMVAKQSN